MDSRPYGRRAFLGLVATGVSSLWWGDAAWRSASGALQGASQALPNQLRDVVPALSSGWRIYTVNPPMPRFEPATWRLRVDGLVQRPVTLDIGRLTALTRADQTSDFHCVTGWSVEDVRWGGVRFDALLAAAGGVRPGAGALRFESAERPYVDTLTLDQAMEPDALLAYEMDGSPLTREHGAPVRVVMPRMYGYKGTKWVSRITVVDRATDGYWEQRGYDRDAWVGRSNGYS